MTRCPCIENGGRPSQLMPHRQLAMAPPSTPRLSWGRSVWIGTAGQKAPQWRATVASSASSSCAPRIRRAPSCLRVYIYGRLEADPLTGLPMVDAAHVTTLTVTHTFRPAHAQVDPAQVTARVILARRLNWRVIMAPVGAALQQELDKETAVIKKLLSLAAMDKHRAIKRAIRERLAQVDSDVAWHERCLIVLGARESDAYPK